MNQMKLLDESFKENLFNILLVKTSEKERLWNKVKNQKLYSLQGRKKERLIIKTYRR
jgi:hypothetical protein